MLNAVSLHLDFTSTSPRLADIAKISAPARLVPTAKYEFLPLGLCRIFIAVDTFSVHHHEHNHHIILLFFYLIHSFIHYGHHQQPSQRPQPEETQPQTQESGPEQDESGEKRYAEAQCCRSWHAGWSITSIRVF